MPKKHFCETFPLVKVSNQIKHIYFSPAYIPV
jgi:hypothetical protein